MAVSEQEVTNAGLLGVALEAPVSERGPSLAGLLGITDRDGALRRLLATGDAFSVLLALATTLTLSGRGFPPERLLWGLVAIPGVIVLFKLYGLYDRDVNRISYSTVDDLPSVLHATVIGGLLLWVYAKFTPMHRLDFLEILSFGLLMLLLTMSVRAALRSLQVKLLGPELALLVGGGKLADLLSAKLTSHHGLHSKLVGCLADDGASPRGVPELPVLGSIEQLESVAVEYGVRRVIVSSGHRVDDDYELQDLLRRCRNLSLKFSLLPSLSDMLGPAVEVDDVLGVTVLGVSPPWLPRSSRSLKRAMDVVIAAAMLLITLPVMLLIAIVIKLDSRGSVFFVQERIGRGGRHFRLLKLRTMVTGADRRRVELMAHSTDPDWLKVDHDPRVTRVGRWLRRLSLDELPQLWNVVRGQMSMVGPRPLIPSEDERVQGWARGRLDLTPGITGYWQVLGRTRIPFEEMVKLDYLYVMNWSLWEDVRLLLRTLPAVVSGRGAN